MDDIETRARLEADEILAQFGRLETLGAFVSEPVDSQKQVFLRLSLINFARREARRPAPPESVCVAGVTLDGECPDCGKDYSDPAMPHAADCGAES